jgi:hypothetical protein
MLKILKKIGGFSFVFIFFTLSFYSFFLIDPSLTLINHPLWEKIRAFFVDFGYFQKDKSSLIYIILVSLLFLNYLFLIKKSSRLNVMKLSVILGVLSIFSYPFLSRDFFNYLFDAKILTFYGKNPYFFKPADFSFDPWLRFMHWTHRTYPYGPVFLLITIFPSFLSLGKFILSFIFFKIMWVFFYLLAVYFLQKINKNIAIIFAFHPLVLIEGLINNHNDLIGVSLSIVGIYYLVKNKNILARLYLILSSGIKYITLPLIFLSKNNKKINYLVLIAIFSILFYLSFYKEIQPWYFLVLFSFLPFFPSLTNHLNIFLFGLLFSYYPYLRYDFWNEEKNIILKHQIILFFLLLNVAFLLIKFIPKRANLLKNKK